MARCGDIPFNTMGTNKCLNVCLSRMMIWSFHIGGGDKQMSDFGGRQPVFETPTPAMFPKTIQKPMPGNANQVRRKSKCCLCCPFGMDGHGVKESQA